MRVPFRWPRHAHDEALSETAEALERGIRAGERPDSPEDVLVAIAIDLQAAAWEAPSSPRADLLRADFLADASSALPMGNHRPLFRVAAVVVLGAVVGIGAAAMVSTPARDVVLAPIESLLDLIVDGEPDETVRPDVPSPSVDPSDDGDPVETPVPPIQPPDEVGPGPADREPVSPSAPPFVPPNDGPPVDPPDPPGDGGPPEARPTPPPAGPPMPIPTPPQTGPPDDVPAPWRRAPGS